MSWDVVVVGEGYVVVIPARVREMVGVREGDLLRVSVEGGRIILECVSPDPFKTLAEVIGEPYSEEEDERRAEEWLKDVSRRH
jgi:AbrB family looped-hinge helix DNA binding protein